MPTRTVTTLAGLALWILLGVDQLAYSAATRDEVRARTPLTLDSTAVQLRKNRLSIRISPSNVEHWRIQQSFRHANGDLSLQGYGSDSDGHVQLTIGASGAFGTVQRQGQAWRLVTDLHGMRLEPPPPTGAQVNHCQSPLPPTRHLWAKRKFSDQETRRQAESAETALDVLIVYNHALAQRYPGGLLSTRLNHLIHIANSTFANSGIDTPVRLVGAEQFDYPNDNSNDEFLQDLAEAMGGLPRNGLQGLASLRDTLGADLVIGIRPHDIEIRGSCGLAYFPADDDRLGVNVVSDGVSSWSFCLDDVLTHEIGHNLGAAHQIGAGGGAFDSRGSAQVRSHRFTTVMGSFGTGRSDRFRGLAMFSTPDLPCGGAPCGDANDIDNVSVMREALSHVLAYRESQSDLPIPELPPRSESDQDGDGVTDWADFFPFDPLEQSDQDGDALGDNSDAFPLAPQDQFDSDEDGQSNRLDEDDDNDSVPDVQDAFPLDPSEQSDRDGDGVGDVADALPENRLEFADFDDDGLGNFADPDDDEDGIPEFSTSGQDLLVVSIQNGRILRFDSETGRSRGVEVPPWDSMITFQSDLDWRPADRTVIYTGDSGVRRMDPINRQALGEWLPPYIDQPDYLQADQTRPNIGSGFPTGIAVGGDGEQVLISRMDDPTIQTFQGITQVVPGAFPDRLLDPDERPVDMASGGGRVFVLGAAQQAIYELTSLGLQFFAGPGADWMQDPARMTVAPDGRVLVSDRDRNAIIELDPAGNYQGELARLGPEGYHDPEGLAVTQNGELLVAASRENVILAFDATTGMFIEERVDAGAGGLAQPGELVLVPSIDDQFNNDPDRSFAPNPGLWYNPASSGRGLDIQRFGSRLAVLWYSYETDGNPAWYLASGDLNGRFFTATLNRFRLPPGGQLETEAVGQISLDFQHERAAQLEFEISGVTGSEPVQWIEITPDVQPINVTGLWGREDGPGWGVTISNQGETSIAVAYFYDANGEPRWAISEPAPRPTDDADSWVFSMLASFSDTLCPGCGGTPANRLEGAGKLELNFQHSGLWTNEMVLPAPLSGSWTELVTPLRQFSEPANRPR